MQYELRTRKRKKSANSAKTFVSKTSHDFNARLGNCSNRDTGDGYFRRGYDAPSQPENVLTPEAALERLIAGNERYIAGQSTPLNFSLERAALVRSQNPYACVLKWSV